MPHKNPTSEIELEHKRRCKHGRTKAGKCRKRPKKR